MSLRKKVMYIINCNQCCHSNFDDNAKQERWGRLWCCKEDKEASEFEIPEWCKLPDPPQLEA